MATPASFLLVLALINCEVFGARKGERGGLPHTFNFQMYRVTLLRCVSFRLPLVELQFLSNVRYEESFLSFSQQIVYLIVYMY